VIKIKVFAIIVVCFVSTGISENIYKEGLPAGLKYIGATNPNTNPHPSFSSLAKVLSPSVVNISVESAGTDPSADASLPEGLPPFFRKDGNLPSRSLGSGIVINSEGLIVTNNHVIDKAKKIHVKFFENKNTYKAEVRGVDDKTDLALIQIVCETDQKACPPSYVPAYFGDSDNLEVGEWVLAIGHQFQLGHTVTAGIISALARKVPTNTPYDTFIQTDASINPGSSGGPLINMSGQVVGINTAIFSPGRSSGTGFNIGIGFAIPINLVKRIVVDLHEHKKVQRGLLGVQIQSIDVDLALALGIESAKGALVAEVIPDSPADKAGLLMKDVILSFDGKIVEERDDLPLMVADTPIGKKVEIEVLRAGNIKKLQATVSGMTEPTAAMVKSIAKADKYGFSLEDLTPEMARSLGLKTPVGAYISAVEIDSIAEKSGFFRGDLILEFAGQTIQSVSMLRKILSVMPKNKPSLVVIRRGDKTRILTLKRDE